MRMLRWWRGAASMPPAVRVEPVLRARGGLPPALPGERRSLALGFEAPREPMRPPTPPPATAARKPASGAAGAAATDSRSDTGAAPSRGPIRPAHSLVHAPTPARAGPVREPVQGEPAPATSGARIGAPDFVRRQGELLATDAARRGRRLAVHDAEEHADRLLEWCRAEVAADGLPRIATYADVQVAYIEMCDALSWRVGSWCAVGRHFAALTGGKRYRSAPDPVTGRRTVRERIYDLGAGHGAGRQAAAALRRAA